MSSQRTDEKSVMQAPLLDKNEEICFRCMDCKTRYECVIQALLDLNLSDANSQGYDRDSYLLLIQGTFTRFEAWASSISTFQDVVLRKKLEFSLNDGADIKQMVMRTLGNLQTSLYEAWLIIAQKKVNESWTIQEYSDSDDEGTTIEAEKTSELQELSKAMENSNKILFKVSNLVQIISSTDDYLKAATLYQSEFDPNVDICLVKEQYGSASGVDDWLITRLGKSLTRRRRYLKYIENYPKESIRNCDNIAVAEEEPVTAALTKDSISIDKSTLTRKDESESGDSQGSQSSDEATSVGECADKLNVPSHPFMEFENFPIQFSVPFQCPYCRTEQVPKDRAAWKEHVFRDLRPYICKFKECELKMFCSLDGWFSHELCNHRREWVCEMCQHTPFSSSPAYEDHLRSEHQINDKGSQLRALVLQGEEPVDDVSATACPFCDNWEKNIAEATKDKYMRLMTFKEHLGKHMEQLALLSLPIKEGKM
ncbi:uncharacterized protein EAF02_009449 [Botrytis sinoallii]|uniref:uncharacterized protein n=1 Tax=Botrytis sinoallii TaxID=1463999 RepID=UPI001901568C|nr:uncharacterized protein EAF02_009449 [Botrytis sinoallii]KAF7868713.1 hypothetical protein EAF02_009449 [Botrytis sinoallii]